MTAVVVLLALAIGRPNSLGAQDGGFALEPFLRDSIGLDAGQFADAQHGHAVSKILPTKSSRDITVFAIIAVHTTRDAYVARLGDFRRIQALRRHNSA